MSVNSTTHRRPNSSPSSRTSRKATSEEVKKALKKKGHNIKEIGPDKVREMALSAVDKYPKFLEKAAKAVAARDEAAADLEIDIG
jgi:ribose 5-phosphate isomerase RpiB